MADITKNEIREYIRIHLLRIDYFSDRASKARTNQRNDIVEYCERMVKAAETDLAFDMEWLKKVSA
jgi:hypothetical protein